MAGVKRGGCVQQPDRSREGSVEIAPTFSDSESNQGSWLAIQPEFVSLYLTMHCLEIAVWPSPLSWTSRTFVFGMGNKSSPSQWCVQVPGYLESIYAAMLWWSQLTAQVLFESCLVNRMCFESKHLHWGNIIDHIFMGVIFTNTQLFIIFDSKQA